MLMQWLCIFIAVVITLSAHMIKWHRTICANCTNVGFLVLITVLYLCKV